MLFRLRRLFGALDLPLDGQLFRSIVPLRGWALRRAGGEVDVEIAIDGEPVSALLTWEPRPDVQDAYRWSRDLCGFRGECPVSGLAPGDHSLTAWAEAGGRRVHLASRRFRVAPSDLRTPSLLFVHIPKTAGTSLTTYLSQQYPADAMWLHAENQVFTHTLPDAAGLSRIDLVSAHLELETIERHLETSRFAFLTVFRQPVGRLISHLVWMYGLRTPARADELSAHPPYVRGAVERLHRLGVSGFLETLTDDEARLFDNCQTRYLLPQSVGVPGERDLEVALRRMEQMAFVGVTERLDDLLRLLASTFGWPPADAPRLNAGVKRDIRLFRSMSARVRSRLDHFTRLDRVIYAEACSRFERQFRDALPDSRKRSSA